MSHYATIQNIEVNCLSLPSIRRSYEKLLIKALMSDALDISTVEYIMK
jgi:hypothetical protein